MSKEDTPICYCRECLGNRNHDIIYSHRIGSEKHDEYQWHELYKIVSCRGCKTPSFLIEEWDENMYFDAQHRGIDDICIKKEYPRSIKGRNTLKNSFYLPSQIKLIYDETINAFEGNCKILVAAGFRAIIEAISINLEINSNYLSTKIDLLHKNGYISKNEAIRLHGVRFLGNEAIHQITPPDEEQLLTVLDIIEHLLSNIYIIDRTAIGNIPYMIENFNDFKGLLMHHLKNFTIGDKKTIKAYLERDKQLMKLFKVFC